MNFDEIKFNSFAFYKVIFLLTKYGKLTWKTTGPNSSLSQITNEFQVEIRRYDSSTKPNVIDFSMNYVYNTRDHKQERDSLLERFREQSTLFKILSCEILYNLAMEQATKNDTKRNVISQEQLLDLYQLVLTVKLNCIQEEIKPFDEILLRNIIELALD